MQVQSPKPDSLAHLADNIGSVEATRKAWIKGPGFPSGIRRPDGRGGDMIRRADGTWWLVTEVSEDFSKAGWISVVITLQVEAPDIPDEGGPDPGQEPEPDPGREGGDG